jgi:hypothetical protein
MPMSGPFEHATYYAENSLAVSHGMLWRIARRFGYVTGGLIFLFFAAAKLFRMRLPPSSARLPPRFAPLISFDQVPGDVQASLAPHVAAANAGGLTLTGVARPVVIGSKRLLEFLLLEPSGRSFAVLSWSEETSGTEVSRTLTFTVSSLLVQDRELQTIAQLAAPPFGVIEQADFAELLPDWIEMEFLPFGTPASQVAGRHAERAAIRSDIVPLNLDNPVPQLLASAERAFQLMVERGLLVPLDSAALERLRKSAGQAVIQAELAT